MGPRRALLSITVAAAVVTAGRLAFACGVSGPDGISGCSLAEHEEAARPRFRLGASGVGTWTALRFDGSIRGDETRAGVLATFGYDPTRRISLSAGLGAALGGELDMPDGRHVFTPGVTGVVGASWRVLEGRPFLSLSADLSFLVSDTEQDGVSGSVGYDAFDLRAGARFGTTLFDALSPFVLARAFGGPVFWRYQGNAVTGTDVYHYQLGGGFALYVARRVDVFVEGSVLGERAVAGGAAVVF